MAGVVFFPLIGVLRRQRLRNVSREFLQTRHQHLRKIMSEKKSWLAVTLELLLQKKAGFTPRTLCVKRSLSVLVLEFSSARRNGAKKGIYGGFYKCYRKVKARLSQQIRMCLISVNKT